MEQIFVSGAVSHWGAKRLLQQFSHSVPEEEALLHRSPTETVWEPQKVRTAPFLTIVAGITAGLLGIGGGVIMGPMLLELGLQPQVYNS